MASEALKAALLERAKRERAKRRSVPVADRFSAEEMATLQQAGGQRALATGGPRMEQERIAAQRAEGERIGTAITDVPKALGAGLTRGTAGLLALPEMAERLGAQAGTFAAEQAAGALGMDRGQQAQATQAAISQAPTAMDRLSQATGGASEFRGETTPGQFAGTVGEFLPGAAMFGGASPANLARFGVAPGVASEAAGQATEGTSLEPFARIAGAVLAPSAIDFGSRAFKALFTRSAQAPTIENLRALKTQAYRDADAANVKFSQQQTDGLIARAQQALDDANFVPEVDLQSKAAFQALSNQRGKQLSLGELDKLRQGLWTRYNADKSQVAILGMIDEIDNVIQSSPAGGELMTAARLANSRFKKAELLDDAFTKAADQTASTGSGGNILNKYRQAVTSIINNPKKSKWFSDQEIAVMREFVRGTTRENLLRLGGKLSPSGNGLMAALNLGAVAVDPTMLAVSAGATAAKAAADRSAMQGAKRLQDMLATGQAPQAATSQAGRVGGLLGGVVGQQ